MKQYGINHYHTYSSVKANQAERFILTLSQKLYRFADKKGKLKYIDILDDIVNNYNHTKVKYLHFSFPNIKETIAFDKLSCSCIQYTQHSTTGLAPAQVNKQTEAFAWYRTFGEREMYDSTSSNMYKIGDYVRLSLKQKLFVKGSRARQVIINNYFHKTRVKQY